MLIEHAVEVAAPCQLVLQALAELSGKDLAVIAGAATSSGEALLEQSKLLPLDEATRCHFGAQLGRPVGRGQTTVFPLRWWNDKSRSLTPGFIGELQVRPLCDELTKLAIVGQYHPRAHLYELVDPAFLGRLATGVVACFLDRLAERILTLTPSPATVHAIAS